MGLSDTPHGLVWSSRIASWRSHASTVGVSRVASGLRVHTCRRHCPGGIAAPCRSCCPAIAAFPQSQRSASAFVFSRLAQRSLRLRPACSPGRQATLYTRGFDCFVASTAAPIATGWSDSCQAGISPAEDLRLVTAHGTPYAIGRERVARQALSSGDAHTYLRVRFGAKIDLGRSRMLWTR